MDYINYILAAAAFAVFIYITYTIGAKKRKVHLDLLEAVAGSIKKEPQGEFLGLVAYHGGLSQLTKPCHLFIGVSENGLIFYENERLAAKVDFANCVKAEKFSVKQKSGDFMKSTVMLGPLVPILFKDKIRNFVTLEHFDVDHEENHILLEVTKKELQKELYDKIIAGVKKHAKITRMKRKIEN